MSDQENVAEDIKFLPDLESKNLAGPKNLIRFPN